MSSVRAYRPEVTPSIGSDSTIEPEHVRCPDCDRAIETVEVNEATCPTCDLVLERDPVSRSPRPAYEPDGETERVGYGPRSTFRRVDRGVGGTVPWNSDRDSAGRILTNTQSRVTRAQPWKDHRSGTAYRLDYALGEIERMGSSLEIPAPERETASRLYRRCHDHGLVAGRSIEGFATACLLVAVRNSPSRSAVLVSELEAASRATTDQIRTARGTIVLEFSEVTVPPIRPRDLLPRVSSQLDVPMGVRRLAQDIVAAYRRSDHGRSLSPKTVVGAAIHAAYDLERPSDRPSLGRIAEAIDTAPSTISTHKQTLLDCYETR